MAKKEKNIMLDLDQTIISSETCMEFPFRDLSIREKCLKFRFHSIDEYYICFERRNLDAFLDYLFENYNVSVFTAATLSYALFIVDKIIYKKPGRKLDYILWSHHCGISKKLYKTPKKLDLLWDHLKLPNFGPHNTIIIDDLDLVHHAQPHACIPIKAFEILAEGSENDKELIENTIPQIEEIFKKLSG